MATKYSLNDTQIRHIAIICFREEGSNDAGVRACASQMCNYYEKYQKKKFKSVYECVFGSGWYWTKSKNDQWVKEHPNVPQSVINAVRDVICNGNRSLPEYVDEYDCLSDIALIINDGVTYTRERNKAYVMNRANYHKGKTIIQNVYAESSYDRYTFYCFPDGVNGSCDLFGYVSKPSTTKTASGASQSVTAPSKVAEKAVRWMEALAADDTHGYSQENRWGPNYDCSSSVISAYEHAGVPVKTRGAYYTGNMRIIFLRCGFKDVTSKVNLSTGEGLVRGDVLLYHISGTNGHTAMYAGNGKIVHARGQSYGSPASGDQGSEIAVTPYSRSKWQYVLRYTGGATSTSTSQGPVSRQTVSYGSVGSDVRVLQEKLNKKGYRGQNGLPLEVDGEFGMNTLFAVRAFQLAKGLEVDGVVGPKTWAKL